MTYEVAFDIGSAGFKSWPFPAFGLIFVAVGVWLYWHRNALPGRWRRSARAAKIFTLSFLAFSGFWTLGTFAVTFLNYRRLAFAAAQGAVSVVEGPVRGFTPMPAAGHAMERFCVHDVCFEYSDYLVTAGFNNTSSHGGPMRDGMSVRVTCVGNSIVKLEIVR